MNGTTAKPQHLVKLRVFASTRDAKNPTRMDEERLKFDQVVGRDKSNLDALRDGHLCDEEYLAYFEEIEALVSDGSPSSLRKRLRFQHQQGCWIGDCEPSTSISLECGAPGEELAVIKSVVRCAQATKQTQIHAVDFNQSGFSPEKGWGALDEEGRRSRQPYLLIRTSEPMRTRTAELVLATGFGGYTQSLDKPHFHLYGIHKATSPQDSAFEFKRKVEKLAERLKQEDPTFKYELLTARIQTIGAEGATKSYGEILKLTS